MASVVLVLSTVRRAAYEVEHSRTVAVRRQRYVLAVLSMAAFSPPPAVFGGNYSIPMLFSLFRIA